MRRAAQTVMLIGLLALAGAARARTPATIRVRFPRFTLPPGANSELCVLVRLPLRKPFDLASWRVHHLTRRLAVRHFLVYLYQGENLAGIRAQAGKVISSRACLDLGPPDRDRRSLIFSANSIRNRDALPPGVALPLAPVPDAPGGPPAGIGLLMDANWVNPGTRTAAASTRVTLVRARRGKVVRRAEAALYDGAEMGLSVPPTRPGDLRSTEDSTTALHALRPEVPALDAWTAAGGACVVSITGHMHERGRFFAVDLLASDGSVANPAGGFPNPFEPGRLHLLGATDYTDPVVLRFSPPLLLGSGQGLHYACWDDNGDQRATRLGCEETAGVVPGVALGLPGGGAAKACVVAGPASPDCPAEDPDYPGRHFTGACVAANLVAGTTPDDEVCRLAVVAYAPGGVPAASCALPSP